MDMPFPKLSSQAVLSPMAGVTDVAFRALARKYQAGLTYTEFVSSTALVRNSKKSLDMVRTDPSEKPVAVQLFGSDIGDVVEAAKMLESQFDVFDINCGCPAWKVIKTGAGSELLKRPEEIGRFVGKLTSAIDKPVTVKIRTGIDQKSINAVQVAKIIEDNGAAAVAIHGRTQKQGYTGKADWDIIKEVKQSVNIPVIGNGDVTTPEQFKQRLEESGVDYIMIARAAIGNPFIFSQITEFVKKGSYNTKSSQEQFQDFLEYAKKYDLPPALVKAHATSFTKGIEGAAKMRKEINTVATIEEIEQIMKITSGVS